MCVRDVIDIRTVSDRVFDRDHRCMREARGVGRFRSAERAKRDTEGEQRFSSGSKSGWVLARDLRTRGRLGAGTRRRAHAYLFGRGLVLRAGEDGVQRADGLVRLGLGRRAPRGAASRPDRGSGDEAIRLAHRRGGRAARGNARARGGRHDDGVSSEHRGVHGHDGRRYEDTRREWKCRTSGAAASASDVAAHVHQHISPGGAGTSSEHFVQVSAFFAPRARASGRR